MAWLAWTEPSLSASGQIRHKNKRKGRESPFLADSARIACRLLAVAGHMIVPVHERAFRIVFPRPNVQFVKCRQAVTVRCRDLQHQVTIHLWSGVGRKHARKDDELDTDQLHFTVRLRLVNQGLRSLGIELLAHDTGKQGLTAKDTAVHVVDAHRAVVRAANAAEGRA